MRIFNTKNETIDLEMKYEQDVYVFKPNGLWYSKDFEWKAWAESNMPYQVGKNYFELDVDLKDVLIINTFDEMDKFYDDYEMPLYSGTFNMIDWNQIFHKFKGIEINIVGQRRYYQQTTKNKEIKNYLRSMNLSSWDINSGCIWDLSCIKGYKLIEDVECVYNAWLEQ